MDIDHRALGDLIEASDDLHADAMAATRSAVADMEPRHRGRDEEEAFALQRRRLMRQSMVAGGALAAAGFGAGLLALLESPAFAQQPVDVQIMQTAASLENLAVATYQQASSLPFMATVPAVMKTFITTTMRQHKEHADAFNAAATRLGGKRQDGVDPVLAKTVDQAKPTLKSPLDVVNLAIQLETGAQETYQANTIALNDLQAKQTAASVMGVEAQHAAVLMSVKLSLQANAPQLIALPPPVAQLPPEAGSAGFPNSFGKTDQARPAAEGAVK